VPRLRSFALTIVSAATLVTLPLASAARGHGAGVPSTGLAGVAYDRAPPDVTFDAGDGPRALHQRFGKPLVLNFWASWCEPCVLELGQLTAAERHFGDRIGIVTISTEPSGIGRAFLRDRGVGLSVVSDPEKHLAKAFGVGAIPVTLVLRADGTLAHVSVGQLDPGELDAALARLLNPPGVLPAPETPEGVPIGAPHP